MEEVGWSKSLNRRTFGSWQIPAKNRQALNLHDGDQITTTIKFGRHAERREFYLTSGGEINVGKKTSERIKSFAKKNRDAGLKFELHEIQRSPISDIEVAKRDGEFKGLGKTEREAIIAARVGQGKFRESLLRVYKGKCAVTGIAIPGLLRASHIRPWRESSNSERLSSHNGLLLIANLDAAFDAHLISFDNSGEMLLSKVLGANPHKSLGINLGSKLTQEPSEQQKFFLKYHQEVFRQISEQDVRLLYGDIAR